MSRVLRAYDSDYVIASRPDGTITLDVGNDGEVVITGNLNVTGESFSVNTTDLNIEDNVIVLNNGETGNGVSLGTSGIEIDRGPNNLDVRWVYDETVSWTLGGVSDTGTFYAEKQGDTKLPLNTPGIVSPGNLYIDTGAGVISVTNTADYEEGVFNYDDGVIKPDASGSLVIDDDHIPNAKAVKDYVDYNLIRRFQAAIAQGNTKVATIDEYHPLLDIVSVDIDDTNTTVIATKGQHGFTDSDIVTIQDIDALGDPLEDLNQSNISVVEVINSFKLRLDVSVSGANPNQYQENTGIIYKTNYVESRVNLTVDDVLAATFYDNRLATQDLEISDAVITATDTTKPLTLQSNGTDSHVGVDDVFMIDSALTGAIPSFPQQGIKLYTDTQYTGKTGLYFANNSNTRDEIVSKNRSLLFSMIF